ncbi:indolepyruvate ferredoxin oxidoreductase subunit alpha [bacterium]|nr:indolepyruvate ferredoxin oxidoreductase subunit alpha [bacterium]
MPFAPARALMSGNEAAARGAYEFNVKVAAGYPGTPSTEILETLSLYKEDVYCEWSPNEKVALEVAAGAALAGARAVAAMKHVGLNVAADPLMTLSYIGVNAGLVVIVADDPGMHSSQNEQDTRQYARFAKIPLLDPSDSQEMKDYLGIGLDISEQFRTPVLLRSTTRISHSKSVVSLGERRGLGPPIGYVKDPARFVSVPSHARNMRVRVGRRLDQLAAFACGDTRLNTIIHGSDEIGIISSSVAYQHAAEAFPEASFLKLGMPYPFPDELIRRFAAGVRRILVVEELDPFIEEHVKALGIACAGKDVVPATGELDVGIMRAVRSAWLGEPADAQPAIAPADVPPRPPVLCPGCPHRAVFAELKRHKPVIIGDIGCYSLAVFPPLESMDMLLCMGAGISAAHGAARSGTTQKIVGVIGDSTFFHSGITGLLDIGWNKSNVTIIVLDNRTTAMTGHQVHPGLGRTLMGATVREADIAAFGRACGINRIREVDPLKLDELRQAISDELDAGEPSLIIARRPCVLLSREHRTFHLAVDEARCTGCGACLRLACPSHEKVMIDAKNYRVRINPAMCVACGLCPQVCPAGAITRG